jgi:hypothetical protein
MNEGDAQKIAQAIIDREDDFVMDDYDADDNRSEHLSTDRLRRVIIEELLRANA